MEAQLARKTRVVLIGMSALLRGIVRGVLIAVWVGAGTYIWWRRPESRLGLLVAGVAFLYAGTSLMASEDGVEQQADELGQSHKTLEAELAESKHTQSKLRQELTKAQKQLQAEEKRSDAEQSRVIVNEYGNDPMALAALVRTRRAFYVTDTELARVNVPVLAVVGTADSRLADVNALKAVMPQLKVVPVPGAASSADSSQGVGGVCSVVSIGMGSTGAIATGRWCRLWLWMRSKCSAPECANCIISVR